MKETRIHQAFLKKGADAERIARRVLKNPKLIPEVLDGLHSEKAPIKFGCCKVIRILSEEKPEILYPEIRTLIGLLDHENRILQWGAIHVLGNLAGVDSKKKIEKILDRYLKPIPGPVMITAANVVKGAAKIALAKPGLTGKVAREIAKVERARYDTDKCRDVALGHVVEAFDLIFEQVENKKPVVGLVRRQLENSRNATRKKAERFLRKWKIPAG